MSTTNKSEIIRAPRINDMGARLCRGVRRARDRSRPHNARPKYSDAEETKHA